MPAKLLLEPIRRVEALVLADAIGRGATIAVDAIKTPRAVLVSIPCAPGQVATHERRSREASNDLAQRLDDGRPSTAGCALEPPPRHPTFASRPATATAGRRDRDTPHYNSGR